MLQMSRSHARRAIFMFGLLLALVVPTTASAWTVTVHVHGAGLVDEITERNLMHCTVGPSGKGESSVTDCVAGTQNGLYNSFDVVQLRALVPDDHFAKGWRFSHWQDSTAGGGKINCDDTGGTGQPPVTDCRFQIFENLDVDLYFEDVSGPQDTSVSGGPSSPSRFTTASFDFNSPSESADARYECRLDRPGQTGAYTLCGGPSEKSESYSGLTANGQYTFYVRAMDLTGNVDSTPASHTWTVDTVAPATTISGSPAHGALTNNRSASLSATANEAASLVCSLDGSPVNCAGTSRSDLLDGNHTFAAQATDAAGNVGPTATRTWTVDTVAPVVTINGSPGMNSLTNDTTPDLTATTNDGTLVCRMDGVVAPCTYTASLADGLHTFSATATDAAGNFHTIARSFTIDATPPVITFTSGPANGSTVNQSATSFAWSADEGGSGFECSLDGADFGQCQALPALPDGTHTYRVRMTDHAGNQASVERTWTIDTAVPDTTLLSGPAEGSTSASNEASFEFASPESGATFECRLDGAAFAACTSPLKLTGLTNDDHVFEVRARDAAGNVDATPVRRAWRVNSLDGDADGVNRPADCDDANPAIRPGATDVPGDGIDQDCADGDAAVVVPPVDSDKDDDGVNAGLDCDDADAAVRPGAVDVPGDGVDQDCKDGDAAFPVTSASLNYNFKAAGKRTRIVRLVLSKIAVGATVKVTCKGRGCPVRSKTVRPSKGTVNVRALLRRKPLRAGNVLTLSITQPGHVAKVVSFKARRGRSPKPAVFRCIEPGSKTPTACP